MYLEGGVRKYLQDDDEDWDEYNWLALEKNTKLKDLNRKNVRHIELIAAKWNRSRMNHINFIDLNPFTPFRYKQAPLQSHASPAPQRPNKQKKDSKRGGTISAAKKVKLSKRAKNSKRDLISRLDIEGPQIRQIDECMYKTSQD